MTRPFFPETRLLIDLFSLNNTVLALGDRGTENPQWANRVLNKTTKMLTEFQEAHNYLATPPDRFMLEPQRVPTLESFSPEFRDQLPDRLSQTLTTLNQLQTGTFMEDQKAEAQDFLRVLFEHMYSQLD